MGEDTPVKSIRIDRAIVVILLFQAAAYMWVLIDVPLQAIRVVLTIISMLFLPGLLLIIVLGVGDSVFEKLIYAVPLSILFDYLVSLLANAFLYLGFPGFFTPSFSFGLFTAVVLMIGTIAYLTLSRSKKRLEVCWKSSENRLRIMPLLLSLPLLSFVGVDLLNRGVTNFVSVIVIFLLLFMMAWMSRTSMEDEGLRVMTLYFVTLSFLLLSSLRSNYVFGVDASYERFVYSYFKELGYWRPLDMPVLYSSSLVVTTFPILISSTSNLPGDTVFKLIFPIVFALISVQLYIFFRRYFSSLTSFLSVVVFIGISIFPLLVGLNRFIVSLLFFAPCVHILMSKLDRKKIALLILLNLGLVMSHYSTALLYCFYLLFTNLLLLILRFWRKSGETLKAIYIALGWILFFVWALHVTWSPFYNFTKVAERVVNFIFEAGSESLQSFAVVTIPSGTDITLIVGYFQVSIGFVVKALMVLGIIRFVFFNKRANVKAKTFQAVSLSLLLATFFLPILSRTLGGPHRFFVVANILTAPMVLQGMFAIISAFTFIGRIFFTRPIKLTHRAINKFAVPVALSYFLAGTGVLLVLAGATTPSFMLQNRGEYYQRFYIHDQEVQAARWLSNNIDGVVWADPYAQLRLIAYGTFVCGDYYQDQTGKLIRYNSTLTYARRLTWTLNNNTLVWPQFPDFLPRMIHSNHNYVFLGYTNVVDGKFIEPIYVTGTYYRIGVTDLDKVPRMSYMLSKQNLLYANGASKVHAGLAG